MVEEIEQLFGLLEILGVSDLVDAQSPKIHFPTETPVLEGLPKVGRPMDSHPPQGGHGGPPDPHVGLGNLPPGKAGENNGGDFLLLPFQILDGLLVLGNLAFLDFNHVLEILDGLHVPLPSLKKAVHHGDDFVFRILALDELLEGRRLLLQIHGRGLERRRQRVGRNQEKCRNHVY